MEKESFSVIRHSPDQWRGFLFTAGKSRRGRTWKWLQGHPDKSSPGARLTVERQAVLESKRIFLPGACPRHPRGSSQGPLDVWSAQNWKSALYVFKYLLMVWAKNSKRIHYSIFNFKVTAQLITSLEFITASQWLFVRSWNLIKMLTLLFCPVLTLLLSWGEP